MKLPNGIYPLRREYPRMKIFEVPFNNFKLPYEYRREIESSMLLASTLYNNNFKVVISEEVIGEYLRLGIDLSVYLNYLLLYTTIREPEIQSSLMVSGYRPEVLSQAIETLHRMRLPKELINMVVELSSPVQVDALEIYVLYGVDKIVKRVTQTLSSILELLPIGAALDGIYEPGKITPYVCKDSRRLSLWSVEMKKWFTENYEYESGLSLDDTAEYHVVGTPAINYPKQFEELSYIGYPFKWFGSTFDNMCYEEGNGIENIDMHEDGTITGTVTSLPNISVETNQVTLTYDDVAITGNLRLLAREHSRIIKDMNFGKAVKFMNGNKNNDRNTINKGSMYKASEGKLKSSTDEATL